MSERTDLMLVATPGGHLQELWSLRGAWEPFTRVWVTMDGPDRSLLDGETVVVAHWQEPRTFRKFFHNFALAWREIGRHRPRVLLTTGAALAVPFALAARLRGTRVVFVELSTRITELSLAARMIQPVAERIYVQWPELADVSKKTHFAGNIFLSGR